MIIGFQEGILSRKVLVKVVITVVLNRSVLFQSSRLCPYDHAHAT